MFLLLSFVYMVIIKTQNRRQKKQLTTMLQNANQNSAFSWATAKSDSEQPSPGATLLGWPKSIY